MALVFRQYSRDLQCARTQAALFTRTFLGGREVSATHLGEKPIRREDAAEKRRSGLGWEPGTEPGRKEPRGRPRPSVSSGGQWCADSHGRRPCRKGPPTLGEPAGLPALRGSGGCLWVPVAQSTLPLGRQPGHGSARQELPIQLNLLTTRSTSPVLQ